MPETVVHQASNRLIGSAEVCRRYDISRVTLWRRVKDDPTFPRPVLWNSKTRRWLDAEIDRHIAEIASACRQA